MYQGEAGFSLCPPGYTPCALTPAEEKVTIIRQLGPVVAVRPPSAASGVNGSPPAGRGPYPRPAEPLSAGNARACSRPQVQDAGSPPSTDVRCVTAVAKACRMTCGAVRRGPDGRLNAGLAGSPSVHACRSSSRLA